MDNKFRVIVVSDLDYEEMTSEIMYEDNAVAMITQENGIDKMEIEIFIPSASNEWKFLLDDFIKAIELAKSSLIEMQKLPDEESTN